MRIRPISLTFTVAFNLTLAVASACQSPSDGDIAADYAEPAPELAPAPIAAAAPAAEVPPVRLSLFTSRSDGDGMHLDGSLGRRDAVDAAPLKLSFEVQPGVTLSHDGSVLPLVDGRPTLTIGYEELVLDADPKSLASADGATLSVYLEQVVANGDKKTLGLYLTRPRASATDWGVEPMWQAAERVAAGQPLPAEGERRGSVVLIDHNGRRSASTLDTPSALRDVRFVAFARYAPSPPDGAPADRTCRYDGGYSVRYYRQRVELVVYDAATGASIGKRQIDGAREDCPVIGSFDEGSPKERRDYFSVDEARLMAELEALVAGR